MATRATWTASLEFTGIRDFADAGGRALVGSTFIYWGGLKAFDSLAGIIGLSPIRGGWAGYMQANGVAYELMPLVILTELGGGVALAVGYRTRVAAIALAGFCLLANWFFHMNWSNPPTGMANWAIFIKNLALAGALLTIAGRGAGRWSLDWRYGRASG